MKCFFSIVAISFVYFGVSCSSGESDEKIPPMVLDSLAFAEVLTELHILDAGSKHYVFPDNRMIKQKYSMYLGILKSHNVTKATWDSTMSYYSTKPQKFEAVYKIVLENLSEKQAQAQSVAKDTMPH